MSEVKLNVAESNKIIAEWMGYGVNWQNGLGHFSNRNYKIPHGFFREVRSEWNEWTKDSHAEINELQFHSSIEWLWPVIEKIEAIGYELILGRNRAYWNDIDGSHTGLEYRAESKLNVAYLAVVDMLTSLLYKDSKPENGR